MLGKRLTIIENNILLRPETNCIRSIKCHRITRLHLLHCLSHIQPGQCLRPVTMQPQRHRLIRRMPLAGKGQRALQRAAKRDIAHAVYIAFLVKVFFNAGNKVIRRHHRPQRMRTRRPDSDLEQIQHTDEHQ